MNPIHISRESIFISAIRSFCNTFFSILGLAICILLIVFLASLAAGVSSSAAKTTFTIQPDGQGNRELLPITTPALLKININGVIGSNTLLSSSIEELLAESREGMLKHNRVKGILLCIDTPGGTVTDSYGIYTALKTYKEKYNTPIFAYVDGTCASGGMYISSAADQIYASPISIIGSIGVILGPVFNFYGLMEQWGIKATTIAKGKDKAMLNPFAPLTPGEDSSLQAISDYLYEHFVSLVTQSRTRLDKNKLVSVYGAQVYAAPTAQELGFIDIANATYEQAISGLALAANIQEGEKYQVIECKIHGPFLSEILTMSSRFSFLSFLTNFLPLKEATKNLDEPFLYLYHPHLL